MKSLFSLVLLLSSFIASAGSLVDVPWLQKNLGRDDVLVVDTSSAKLYAAKHIPGAVNIDPYGSALFGRFSPAQLEQRLQAWGMDPALTIVIHDEGASWTATWLFSELHYLGFPLEKLVVLDGGLAKWEAMGGAVTRDPSSPKPGSFRIAAKRDGERSMLPEFMNASGDLSRNVLVDAMEASFYYGGAKNFDRPGHVPGSISMPVSDFYRADKTFKSPEEIRKMATFMGIKPEHAVYSHCGGGGASSVPYFALKFLAGHQNVREFKGSQRVWLQDERELPFWTYATPSMSRDANWVNTWGGRMMRMFGIAQISVVDVRSAEAFRENHVPYAVSIPSETFKAYLGNPAKMAEILAAAGVNPAHEALIVSSPGGVNESSAIAFAVLEQLGQKKVSVLRGSVDDWALRGYEITKEPTIVGAPKSPKDYAVPPATYPVNTRDVVVARDSRSPAGAFPRVYLASGKKPPSKAPEGKVIHVPYAELVGPDGAPRPANEIWNALSKAGVPRHAEIICIGDDPSEAAVNYYVLKLMGFPDVKVLAS